MNNSNTYLRRLVAFVIVIISVSGYAWALDPSRALGQYLRRHWGPDNGFSAQHICAITQTHDGELWIGTDVGLFRFDGFSFVQVHDESANAFSLDHIYGLVSENNGDLWIQLRGPTLLLYRNGQFAASTPGPSNEDSRVTAISRTPDGRLLLASRRDGVGFRDGSEFHMIREPSLSSPSPVISIAESAIGDIWLGTQDAGVIRISGHQIYNIRKGLPSLKINCLLAEQDGALLVATDQGMVRWNGREFTGADIPDMLRHAQILTMIQDRDSNVWIGTSGRGLSRLNHFGLSSISESVRTPAVTALFEDREGDVWVGSANGMEQLRESAFTTYYSRGDTSAENNGPIFSDADKEGAVGRIWWAPASGGLYWGNGARVGRVTEAGLARDVVYSISGGNQDLWLARQRGGLTHLYSQHKVLHAKTYTEVDGLGENSVFAVHQNRDGTVWAGTLTSGVSHFHDDRVDRYTQENGLPAGMIRSIAEGLDGTMWFATPRGLGSFRGNQWKTYSVDQGLPSENVYSLFVSSGVLWVGTQRGLCFFRSGHLETTSGLPSSLRQPIFGVAEDKLGSLWIVTAKAVQRVACDRMLHGPLRDGDVREYGMADGLRNIDGVPRDRSIAIDKAGRIWISRKHGLAMVDPVRSPIAVSTITRIDHLKVDGALIDLHQSVFIAPRPRRIEIDYTGLNLSAPERIRFRFRLDGFDRAWSMPIEKRDIFFTNLGPGSYRFHVVASNTDGVWNGSEAVMLFTVDPALWQTWWFRLGAFLLLSAATVAAYRWRIHELTGRVNLRFDERLAERTRLARELHDTLLQTIEGSKLVADDALDTESNEVDAHRLLVALEKVSTWLGDATKEARAALSSLRNPVSQQDDLVQAFQRAAAECMRRPGSMRINLSVEGTVIELRPIVQDEIFRIGHEALRNACLHSNGNQIELEISYSKNLTLRVRDDGKGISPELAEEGKQSHFGLLGMKERAGQIGGKLNLFSSAESGTEIELIVPGGIAYVGRRRGLIGAVRGIWSADRRPSRVP
ncbi:MAG: two-component regulator propeller domain-containing protein [Bryobacteraceae bacterium]